jgi:hypothetical protein
MEIFILFGIFVLIIIIVDDFSKQKILKNFKSLAERLNLEFRYEKGSNWEYFRTYPMPELHGKLLNNFPAKIYIKIKGSGKQKIKFLTIEIKSSLAKRHYLILKRERFFNQLEKKLNINNDIQIRDEDFDKKILISSDNHLYAKALLVDPDTREFILNHLILIGNNSISINKDILSFEKQINLYYDFNVQKIEAIIKFCLELMQKFKENEDFYFKD